MIHAAKIALIHAAKIALYLQCNWLLFTVVLCTDAVLLHCYVCYDVPRYCSVPSVQLASLIMIHAAKIALYLQCNWLLFTVVLCTDAVLLHCYVL